jgi:hypothetical protein
VGHNLRAAGADAAVLMNSLHLPPSAARSPGEPFGDDGVLGRSPESAIVGGAQVVDERAFWTSPRSPRAILALCRRIRRLESCRCALAWALVPATTTAP